MKPLPILLVGLGGFAGAVARFAINTAVGARLGGGWPWATFLINLSGCFAIGFFFAFAAERAGLSENWRYLFPVGFVGAYTTFSTYAYETVRMVDEGAWLRALAYVTLSTVLGFAAVVAAMALARRF